MKRRRPPTQLRPAPERLEEKSLPSAIVGLTSVPTPHVSTTHQTHAALARLAHERRAHAHHKPSPVEVGKGKGNGNGINEGGSVGAGNGVGVGAGNGVGVGAGNGVGAGAGNGVGAGVGNGNVNGGGNSNGSGVGTGVGAGSGVGEGGFVGGRVGASALTLGPDSGLLGSPVGMVLAAGSTPLVGGAVYNLALITVRNGTSQTFSAQSGLSVEVSGSSGTQPFPTGSFQWKPGQVLVVYSLNEDTFPPDFTFNLQGTSTEVPTNIYYGIQYSPNTISSILNSIVTTELVGGRYELVST